MKRLLIPTSLLIFLFAAQFMIIPAAKAQSPIQFGLKGGVNVSNFNGTDLDFDSRTGGLLGLSLTLNLPVIPIGIETGLYYSQKGAKSLYTEQEVEVEETLRLDYLEVPILARFDILPLGMVRPHIIAGPYFAYNVNSEFQGSINNISVTDDFSDFTRQLDTGLLFGAGTDVNIGIARLSLQVRYSLGLTPVLTEDFEDGERNSVLNLTVGYGF